MNVVRSSCTPRRRGRERRRPWCRCSCRRSPTPSSAARSDDSATAASLPMCSASLRAGINTVTDTRPDGRPDVASARSGRARAGMSSPTSDPLGRPRIQAKRQQHPGNRCDDTGDHQHRCRCRVHQQHLDRPDRHFFECRGVHSATREPTAWPPPSLQAHCRESTPALHAPATTHHRLGEPPRQFDPRPVRRSLPHRRHSRTRTLPRQSRGATTADT